MRVLQVLQAWILSGNRRCLWAGHDKLIALYLGREGWNEVDGSYGANKTVTKIYTEIR